MKAIRVNEFGGPEVLRLEENIRLPVPSDTQVTHIPLFSSLI